MLQKASNLVGHGVVTVYCTRLDNELVI
jgi:hypothetical protein